MMDDHELAIIGAGAAGCTAGIYAGRSGIDAVIFDRGMGGGLILTAPRIENYPGFMEITGAELSSRFLEHARKYADLRLGEEVTDIKRDGKGFILKTTKGEYGVRAVILSTGSKPKKLGVEGEEGLHGKGVSYCATCDGFFFKGKRVAVIGGGSKALLDAIYLKQIGCKEVYLIHRRDVLRGERILQEEARDKGVRFLLNRIVKRLEGEDRLERVTLEDKVSGREEVIDLDGAFIAVGEEPENGLAKILGVELDENGYIKVDEGQRTNIRGVYAAGDVTGGVRQIITACAEGAVAALSSTEILGKKYPY